MVHLFPFLGYIVDARREARRLLNRHHMKLNGEFLRQLNRRYEPFRPRGKSSFATGISL